MLKVLHILDCSLPVTAGYTIRSSNLLEAEKRLGVEPVVLTSPNQYFCGDTKNEDEDHGGIRHHRTRAPRGSAWIKKSAPLYGWHYVESLTQGIRRLLTQEKFDLLHAHSPFLNGLAAARVAREKKLPWVYQIRAFWEDAAFDSKKIGGKSLRYRISKTLETYIIKKADAVVVISEGLKRDLLARGLDETKICITPNGVDPAAWSEAPRDEGLTRKYDLEGKIVLGYIGTLFRFEGIPFLIQAFSKLAAATGEVRLMIIGGGEDEEKCRALVKSEGLEEKVFLIGRVSHQEIPKYYSLIDLMVYPRHRSRLTELVTPIKPLEAMALGKLVLGSDVGGLKEIVRPGTGFLFKAEDTEDFCRTVQGVLQQRDSWEMISRNARNYVAEKRNWSAIVKNQVGIYESLCSR